MREDTPILPDLAVRLQRVMDAMGAGEAGCFIKTSSRSAKDHAPADQLREQFSAALTALGVSAPEENVSLIAMSFASMEQLRMHSAPQVMRIFAASERIFHDMNLSLATHQHAGEGSWAESLVVRRWVELEPDMELRCFVSDGRLVAVSQYRHLLHLPRLVANRTVVLSALRRFCDRVALPKLRGAFPRDDYVLDIALELDGPAAGAHMLDAAPWPDGDGAIRKVWAIEVNPYFETTDGCLFSWSRDRAILTGGADDGGRGGGAGDDGPVFRLRERPAKGASSLIYGQWREVLGEHVDPATQDMPRA